MRTIRLPLFLILICIFATANDAEARSYYVTKSGNDRNPGTSRNQPFQTLARAFRELLSPGDVIYVGAGTYSESISIPALAASSSFNKSGLRIVADITGNHTGSRGPVVINPPSRWSFIARSGNVQFEGITFGPGSPGGRYYGIYANGASTTVTAINCEFRNLYYGILAYSGSVAVHSSRFTGDVYGVYGSGLTGSSLQNCSFTTCTSWAALLTAQSTAVTNCTFTQSRYGLYVVQTDRTTAPTLHNISFSDCQYGLYCRNSTISLGEQSVLSTSNCTYGIYLNSCDTDLADITLSGGVRPLWILRGKARIRNVTVSSASTYGILAQHMEQLEVADSSFSQTGSWNLYAHGRDMAITGCRFEDSSYGLYIQETSGNSVPTLKNLVFNKCGYAIRADNSAIELGSDNNISMTDCTYGLYLSSCRTKISNLTIPDGYRPLFLNRGEAEIDNLTIASAGNYGLYSANMTKLNVSRSAFGTTGSWAIHAHGTNLSIGNCSFSGSSRGLYVRELDENVSVALENLTFTGCSYGMQCDYANLSLSPESGISFSNCTYGLIANACDSKLRGLAFEGGYRPLTLNRGKAVIDQVSVKGSTNIGIYTASMDSLDIRNCRLEATGSWAAYAHGQNLSVTDSSFAGPSYGLYVRETSGQTALTLKNLSFSQCAINGLRVDNSRVTLTDQSNIRLSDCGTGVYLINCTSELHGMKMTSCNIPLYVNGGTCVLNDIAAEQSRTYGIFATRVNQLDATNVTCSGGSAWGFYAYGNSLSLSDSSISGARNGVYLRGLSAGETVPVSNLDIRDNTGYGLYMLDAELDVAENSKLTIANNSGTGLYVTGQNLELDGNSGIELTGNGVGLYANRTNVKMSDFKLSGNRYGVLQYYGDLECRNSSITGGTYGIYHVHGQKCLIEDSTISGTSSWGLLVTNSIAREQQVLIRGSRIEKNGAGINATLSTDGTLQVDDSIIADNRNHGIYSWRADTRLTKSSISDNSGYGIIHYDGPLSVEDSSVQKSRNTGIMAYGYSAPAASKLSVRRSRVERNSSGIYAYRVADADIVNNVAAGNTSYGIAARVNSGGQADVWNNSVIDSQFGIWLLDGHGSVKNNIIANGDMKASRKNAYGIYRTQGTLDHGHNLLFGQSGKYINTTPGVGDVIKPPRFVNYAAGDFRLAAGSPAINAGTSAGGLTTRDQLGLKRPMFDAFEIGAFEFPEKSGSIRILDWGELATPPSSMKN